MTDIPTGSLRVKVMSASGKIEGVSVWEKGDFEAYVKVEMRGTEETSKARTAAVKNSDGNLLFTDQTLILAIPAGAEEVRLKICKERKTIFGVGGSSVMANAGIYLRDLLRFVPIEKQFNLFKPSDKNEGGSVRLFFDLVKANTTAVPKDAPAPDTSEEPVSPPAKSSPDPPEVDGGVKEAVEEAETVLPQMANDASTALADATSDAILSPMGTSNPITTATSAELPEDASSTLKSPDSLIDSSSVAAKLAADAIDQAKKDEFMQNVAAKKIQRGFRSFADTSKTENEKVATEEVETKSYAPCPTFKESAQKGKSGGGGVFGLLVGALILGGGIYGFTKRNNKKKTTKRKAIKRRR